VHLIVRVTHIWVSSMLESVCLTWSELWKHFLIDLGWCANELFTTPTPADGGESDCNLLCHGDDSEICGGSLRISLYELSTGPFDVKPASSTTVDDSAATTAVAAATSKLIQI
jgi:hypothetical protein